MGGGGRVEEVTRGREGVRVAKGKRKRERGNNRIKSAKRDPGRESNKRKTGRCEKQQSRTQKAAAQVTGPRNGKGGREDGRGKEEERGEETDWPRTRIQTDPGRIEAGRINRNTIESLKVGGVERRRGARRCLEGREDADCCVGMMALGSLRLSMVPLGGPPSPSSESILTIRTIFPLDTIRYLNTASYSLLTLLTLD